MVGTLSLCLPLIVKRLCETVAVTLQMLLKKFSPGGAGGCLGITSSGGSRVRDWGADVKLHFSYAVDHSLLSL